ncbi:cyclin-like protein [Thamnidium elegans]|uniref:Cyclin-like domain-containing protein n=1 Tax=Thamnidium elegans TaxID=101142 RepID=A0A8H7SU87_9FUNG|nr:hypothetical protein INT48_000488 [Thamnidium elegans]KAI8094292.1 cyclin-like protein [Thamnidium elegans]
MSSQWFMHKEDSKNTPSILNGMRYEEELLYRMRGVCLIQIVGYRLELPVHTVATASTLYHRFFTRKSFYDYKYTRIAQACLFIACKSDESSRRAQDIAKSWTYKPKETRSEKAIAKFISDLLYNELLVLEVVCFDMSFEHPYYDMLEFVKEVGIPNEIATAALAFINDSFRLPLNLWYEPKAIAATALVMGYQTSGTKLPSDTNTNWAQYLQGHSELIGEIAASIMEVYKLPKYTEKK